MIKTLLNNIIFLVVLPLLLLRMQVSYHKNRYLKLSIRKALRKQNKSKLKEFFFGVKTDSSIKYQIFYRITIIVSDLLILLLGIVVLGIFCALYKCMNTAIFDCLDSIVKISCYISLLVFSLNTILYVWDDRVRRKE